MRRAVLTLLLGCNQLYGLDPTELDGPRECATVRFGAPQSLVEFEDGFDEHDPQLSSDRRELWMAYPMVDGTFAIHRSVRASTEEPFGPPALVDLGGIAPTRDPTLTADGRRLLFFSQGRAYEAVREGDAFDVRSVVGLTDRVQSLDISYDGLRIYFTNSGLLYTARRPSLDEPFAEVTMLFDNADYPSVSPDELEVFYEPYIDVDPDEIHRRVRDDVDSPFGPSEIVLQGADDADVNPEGETLIVSNEDGGLAILERACP